MAYSMGRVLSGKGRRDINISGVSDTTSCMEWKEIRKHGRNLGGMDIVNGLFLLLPLALEVVWGLVAG